MSFFGYWLPSQPQINEPAMLNRPTRPIAQPPSSRAETGVPKNDMPTALSEMYAGRWSPINVTWKPHEEADGEQPEALRLERLLQRVFAALRDRRARPWGRGTLFPQSEGERHHHHRHRAEDEHGRMPVVEPILQ